MRKTSKLIIALAELRNTFEEHDIPVPDVIGYTNVSDRLKAMDRFREIADDIGEIADRNGKGTFTGCTLMGFSITFGSFEKSFRSTRHRD